MLPKEDVSFPLTEAQIEYFTNYGYRTNELKLRLRQKTHEIAQRNSVMLGDEFQGDMITQLLKTMNARKAIEVGVFTGYTTLCMAQGLSEDGKVYALDISSEWASVGQPFWEEAGVASKIELVIGQANDTLDRLIAEGHSGTFDFAFVDADKVGYASYYEKILILLRQGGSIFFDNCMWSNKVLDPEDVTPSTVAIRLLNESLRNDPRVMSVLLPLADGTHFVTKL